jgi:galactose mutarotase-like enzyme
MSIPGAIEISNDFFRVIVSPDKGADISQIIYKPKMLPLLLETGWDSQAFKEDSKIPGSDTNFLAKYRGGWQLMIPNAGFGCTLEGVEHGYHGEAWERKWDVILKSEQEIKLCVNLHAMPLRVTRNVKLDANQLFVIDEVTNQAQDVLKFIWGNHPAFSEECLADAELEIFASELKVLTDPPPPPNKILPKFLTKKNNFYSITDLFKDEISFLAIFSNFVKPQVNIHNKKLNLKIELSWSSKLFRNVWFWLENRGLSTFPWNKSITTLGIEPCSTNSNMGLVDSLRDETNLVELFGGESKTSVIALKIS